MKAEQYKETRDELAGWPVQVISYKVGGVFHVTINNVSPGAWVAKAQGSTLEEAERQARADAGERLGKTRRVTS